MPTVTVNTVTVTGTFLLADLSGPATGSVLFEMPRDLQALLNPPQATIHVPVVNEVSIDSAGRISVPLMVTDDPSVSPAGWTYRVTEKIIGASGRRPRHYNISVPFSLSGGTLDLSTAAIEDPFTEAVGLSYVLLPIFNALDARVRALELGIGPGGGGGPGFIPPFTKAGTVAVAQGKNRLTNKTGVDLELAGFDVTVWQAPIDGDLVIDVMKDNFDGGGTLFTTVGKPTITDGTIEAPLLVPDITAWRVGEYLTVDVLAVGTTIPGWDLTVQPMLAIT